jgi:hypothetical protein
MTSGRILSIFQRNHFRIENKPIKKQSANRSRSVKEIIENEQEQGRE